MPKGVYQKKQKSLQERFLKHVTYGSGCWNWGGAIDRKGYGIIWGGFDRDTNLLAHRVSWEVTNGIVPKGLCVCHKCDNPSCVNPTHLFLGTKAENNADRDRKGRGVKPPGVPPEKRPRGERHHQSVLTKKQVDEIRASTVGTNKEIGDRYGVSKTTVRLIRIGKAWSQEFSHLQGGKK